MRRLHEMKNKVFAFKNLKEQIKKQALSKLESGKLKDTVDQYKKLLTDSDTLEQHKQQVNHYLQKARDLTAKEVFNDVQKRWYERLGNDQQSKRTEQILVNLIQSQDQDEIQRQLENITIEQIDQQYLLFSRILGALMLTNQPELEQYLPAASAFVAHFKSAREALTSFRDDSPDEIRKFLKKIPYHSAFRDFRTLMNAVLAMPFLSASDTKLLNRIPQNSPYFQAARSLLSMTAHGGVYAQNLKFFNSRQRNIIADIKGLNEEQRLFAEQLAKLRQPLTAEEKFNLAIQFQSYLGRQFVQPLCLSLLPDYPEGFQAVKDNFLTDNEFEQNRVQALLAEQDENIESAELYWRQCIRVLAEEGAGNHLKIALILRHLAAILPESEQLECLMESLQYDSDDQESLVQILKHFCQKKHLDDNDMIFMEEAIKQFPEDIEILGFATQIANQNNNQEKALVYAEKTLRVDPFNNSAKQVIVSIKVEQIRNCLQNKNIQQANNAIQQLKTIKLSKNQYQQVQLLEAFFCFAGQDKQQGLEKIVQAFTSQQIDPLNSHFQAAMEAQLAGLPVATILKTLPSLTGCLLSVQSFELLVNTITRYVNDEGNNVSLHKSLEKIKTPLKRSLQQSIYDENLLLAFCEALIKIKHFELLRYISRLAQKKWPASNWVFYLVIAETNNNPEQCSIQQYLALKSELAVARKHQEYRIVLMLEQYIEHYLQAHPQQNLDMIEDAFGVNDADFQEQEDGPMERLFGRIPDHEFFLLNKEMAVLAKKLSPEQLAGQMLPGQDNSTILSTMMKEPDLYTAMLVLKAADKLNIEINVSSNEVLKCFGINK